MLTGGWECQLLTTTVLEPLMSKLLGKVALVTGAGQGVGKDSICACSRRR